MSKSDYEFEAKQEGEFTDRFTLMFKDPNLSLDKDLLINGDEFIVSNSFDVMSIKSNRTVNEIKVYDLLGRMIIHEAPKQRSFQLETSSVKVGSILLIEAQMEDGTFYKTKSIKYWIILPK